MWIYINVLSWYILRLLTTRLNTRGVFGVGCSGNSAQFTVKQCSPVCSSYPSLWYMQIMQDVTVQADTLTASRTTLSISSLPHTCRTCLISISLWRNPRLTPIRALLLVTIATQVLG